MKAERQSTTILVVDGYEILRALYRRILRNYHYSVVTAGSGAATLRLVQKQGAKLDLVLMDVQLHDREGEEIVQEIRRLQPDLPCLIIADYCEDAARARILGLGRCAIMTKPPALHVLTDKVKAFLAAYPRALPARRVAA